MIRRTIRSWGRIGSVPTLSLFPISAGFPKRIAGEAAKACARAAEPPIGAYQRGKVIVSVPLVALGLQTNLQN